MPMQELREWDAVATGAAIRGGEVSAAEAVEAAIARAEDAEQALHAFVVETFDDARLAAKAIGQRRAANEHLPVFAGVPSVVKDLSDVAGVPSRYGSRALTGHVPTATGAEVEQLLSTGLVSLGKSATPEFGLVATTEPLFCAPTRNPWDLQRSAGGSSGGSAALVAAGVVPIAHATDGGGSIRIPAAVNGLVGLKPTNDRFMRLARMEHLPIKISVTGVVTRTVRDTAAFAAAAERFHRNPDLPAIGDVRGPGQRRVRIAVTTEAHNAPVEAPIVAAVAATADRLADAGHEVFEVDLAFPTRFGDDFVLYWAGLAMAQTKVLERGLPDHFDPALVDPFTRTLAAHARANLARLPGAILRLRRFAATYRSAFEDFDVALTPTLAQQAPLLGATSPELEFDELEPKLVDYVQFTPPHNVAGAPAISLPAGMHQGLPIGVMLAALPGDERTLIELAYELEAVAPWPQLAPVPSATGSPAGA